VTYPWAGCDVIESKGELEKDRRTIGAA